MKKIFTRLGIFVFYDPDGIVDSYVTELLCAFRPHFKKLVVISNVPLDSKGKEALERYSDALFVRENSGFDAAAFKDGLTSFCGWKEVAQYDEVVLINDTFFGPMHSFDKMFKTMSQREVDFWGWSAGYPAIDGWGRVKYGYIPDHIQTFFVAFRKNMVCSEAFQSYWNNYDHTMNDFVSVVTQHEMVMTKHFQDLGFRWEIYADSDRYRSQHISENFTVYHYHAHKMMQEMNFPVLKKKVFNISMPDHLYMSDLEDQANALRYIQTETDYDVNLIWDNVLRLYNTYDLYQSLHLNHVLPSAPAQNAPFKEAAVVFFVTNPLFIERICNRASELGKQLDVYILAENGQIQEQVRKVLPKKSRVTILDSTNQSTEMGSFFIGCKKLASRYTYLGFLHDLCNPMHYPTTVIESAVYGYMQNVANDINYVSQVLNSFSQNPRLGVLGAPFPIHHFGFQTYGSEWGCYYPDVKQFAEEMGLKCKMEPGKPPVVNTGAFWCRTKALKRLWEKDWSADQFYLNPVTKISAKNEMLKRLLPFAAQNEGYYSGVVMHTDYASMRLTSQQYMLDQIIFTTRANLGCSSEIYAGYIQQLRAVSIANSNPGAPVVITNQIGLRGALGIYLKKHLPNWLSSWLISLFRLR